MCNNKLSKKYQVQLRRFYSTHYKCDLISQVIGCSKDQFKDYIDINLTEDMSPMNAGIKWDFDHIVPVDVFDLSSQEELKVAYNYKNILPMAKEDNKAKGSSIHFSKLLIEHKLTNRPEDPILNTLLDKCKLEVKRYDKYFR